MKVSIVITCFNYGRYVAEAIDSALSQTHPDVEVVVVDDGSTDDSPEVIRRYEGRVRSIRQANAGSIAAYNRGYEASTGDLVVFLDADDLISSEAAAACVAAWQPGVVKVQFDLAIINGDGEDLGRKFCDFVEGYDAAAVRASFVRTGTYRWPVTAGNAYARGYLVEMMPLSVEHGPDGLLNTVAPVHGEVVTIARCLGSYRLHGSNMWSSDGADVDRLPRRIAHRLTEIAAMRLHARRRDMALPDVNPLDHELAFINYRLMALRLGYAYAGSTADTPRSLWLSGMHFLGGNRLSIRMTLAHALWLCSLALAPRPLARGLIRLRFDRAAYLRPLRRLMARRASWGPGSSEVSPP